MRGLGRLLLSSRLDFIVAYRESESYIDTMWIKVGFLFGIYEFHFFTINNNIYFNKNHIYARRYDLEGKLLRVGSIEVSNNNNNNLFVSYFPFN